MPQLHTCRASFLRVGRSNSSLEGSSNSHNEAFNELKIIVQHLIDRNYKDEIDPRYSFNEQVIN